jgi:hypothetical protein
MDNLFGDAEKDYLPAHVSISAITKLFDIKFEELLDLIDVLDDSIRPSSEQSEIKWELYENIIAILEHDVCEGTCKRRDKR